MDESSAITWDRFKQQVMPWFLFSTGEREVERNALSILKDEWEERRKTAAGDGRKGKHEAGKRWVQDSSGCGGGDVMNEVLVFLGLSEVCVSRLQMYR